MGKYIARRIILSSIALLGVSAITFFSVFASGDPVVLLLPPTNQSAAEIEAARVVFGLDRPLGIQYLDFLGRAVRGDFGRSLRYDVPAMTLVLQRLPATVILAASAVVLAGVIGIPLGIVAAMRKGSILDDVVVAVSALGLATPTFWTGTMLIVLFAVHWRVFPPSGGGSLDRLILPMITLALLSLPVLLRFTRSGMIEVLAREYMTTARSKGLGRRDLMVRHALPNTLIPIITVFGLEMGTLLSGAVVTENVFAWPGIGELLLTAVVNRDFPVVIAVAMTTASMFLLINLVVDVLYVYINPTIRLT